jgi:hypothetical protein
LRSSITLCAAFDGRLALRRIRKNDAVTTGMGVALMNWAACLICRAAMKMLTVGGYDWPVEFPPHGRMAFKKLTPASTKRLSGALLKDARLDIGF